MVSSTETSLARVLRGVLELLPDGADIPESSDFQEVLNLLEGFVQEVLVEVYPEWKDNESLDGILPRFARKNERREAEIFGMCILVADQSLTPIHLRLQIAADRDEVSWLEFRVGERGEQGMKRAPWNSSKQQFILEERAAAKEMDWMYKVTFGHRTHGGASRSDPPLRP